MDETQNNGMQEHHKVRWIIVFVACLIILVALVMMLRPKPDVGVPTDTTSPQVVSEEDLVRAMTAKPSTLTSSQIQSVLEASSADSSGMTSAQKQDLIDAMSSQ